MHTKTKEQLEDERCFMEGAQRNHDPATFAMLIWIRENQPDKFQALMEQHMENMVSLFLGPK